MKKYFMIDLDGTIYHRTQILPYANEFIDTLKKNNTDFVFFTNSPELSRKDMKIKLNKMNIDVELNNILTAGNVAIDYIKKDCSDIPSVFVLGSDSFKKEIIESGFKVINGTDEKADYVLVGFSRELSLIDLENASTHILNGSKFICTNSDRTIPSETGLIPHTGAILKYLEYATNKTAIDVGKPNKETLNTVLKRFNCEKEEIIVVGDNLETDIKFGENFDLKTFLVMTGLTTTEHLKNYSLKKCVTVINNLNEII